MQTIQTSRRIFLSNLAIITAGTIWARTVPSLFTENRELPGPESTWNAVCTRYKGSAESRILINKKELPSCNGHTYREGQLIYFPAEKIRAQPVWIYWANNKRPSDLIVHFYRHDHSVMTLNLYELQALSTPVDACSKTRMPPLTTFLKVNSCGQRAPMVQTTVYSNTIKTVYIS